MPGRSRFSKSRFHERDHGPPLPARFGHIARPGNRGSRGPFHPCRSASPNLPRPVRRPRLSRVSPSVRIPGNCACVRPPHRMPPPTRTANRIIGRTRLSGCCPPPRQPPVHTTSRPVRIRFPRLSPLPVAAPHIRCPARSLSPPATVPASHTYGARSGSGPGPPHSPYSLRSVLSLFAYSASFSRLLLRAFPFPKIFSIGNLFYRKINSTFVPLSLTNNDENT